MKTKLPTPPELLTAYSQGYFPMPDPETNEILWFRPDPRAILPLNGFHVSKSLSKQIQRHQYEVTFDKAFSEVMKGCADRKETWITDEFMRVYGELHSMGYAHSVEIRSTAGELTGGVYGVSLGGAFFAESMFHRETNASKLALYHLVEHLKSRKFVLLETQFLTPHLSSLGAKDVTDLEYQKLLNRALVLRCAFT